MIHPSSNVPPPFGGTDDLHIATRQRGFQDVGRIHGATVATAAGTHQGVDLVNHQNDVRIVTHFLFSKLRNPPKKMRKKNFRKWPQHATTQERNTCSEKQNLHGPTRMASRLTVQQPIWLVEAPGPILSKSVGTIILLIGLKWKTVWSSQKPPIR